MASFNEIYRGFLSGAGNIGLILIIAVPIIIIAALFAISIRNKRRFIYPVRIFRIRENGKVLERNVIGGYITRKGSSPYFRIKLGKGWWKYKDLLTTPDLRYMDEENRLYYRQDDIDTFAQIKRHFDAKGDVHYSPVDSDVKYGAILSIQRIRQLTGGSDKWKTVAAIGGMVLVFTLAIVIWALMMNAKCPVTGG